MSKENLKNNVDYDGLKSVVINKTFCYDNLALKKSLEGLYIDHQHIRVQIIRIGLRFLI